VNCDKAERQERETFATNLWKNLPDPSYNEHIPPTSPPILEDDEIVNMPDITLEDDLLGVEDDLNNTMVAQEDTPPGNENAPDQSARLHVTIQDAEEGDKEAESAFYIEEFPANLGAGAVWGKDVPFFEKLWREQEENGSSRWGPFEDQDEWELAMWLIRNVGHKQINAFLNLKIVSSHHFEKFDGDTGRSLISSIFDRHGNKRSHPFITAMLF
jgi:hypothetical protein